MTTSSLIESSSSLLVRRRRRHDASRDRVQRRRGVDVGSPPGRGRRGRPAPRTDEARRTTRVQLCSHRARTVRGQRLWGQHTLLALSPRAGAPVLRRVLLEPGAPPARVPVRAGRSRGHRRCHGRGPPHRVPSPRAAMVLSGPSRRSTTTRRGAAMSLTPGRATSLDDEGLTRRILLVVAGVRGVRRTSHSYHVECPLWLDHGHVAAALPARPASSWTAWSRPGPVPGAVGRLSIGAAAWVRHADGAATSAAARAVVDGGGSRGGAGRDRGHVPAGPRLRARR